MFRRTPAGGAGRAGILSRFLQVLANLADSAGTGAHPLPLAPAFWLLASYLLVVFLGLIFNLDALDLHFDSLRALVVAHALHFGDLQNFQVVLDTIGAGHGTPEDAKWHSH